MLGVLSRGRQDGVRGVTIRCWCVCAAGKPEGCRCPESGACGVVPVFSEHRRCLAAGGQGVQGCRAQGSKRATLLGLCCVPARSEQFPKPCAKYFAELRKIFRNY